MIVVSVVGIAAAVVLGALLGVASGSVLPLVVSVAAATAVLGGAVALPTGTRSRFSLFLIWTGLIGPLVIPDVGAVSGADAVALDSWDAVRGGLPIACFAASLVVFPRALSPLNRVEKLVIAYACVALLSTFWSIEPLATALKATATIGYFSLIILIIRAYNRNHAGLIAHAFGLLCIVIGSALFSGLLAPNLAFVQDGSVLRLAGFLPRLHPNILGLASGFVIITIIGGSRDFTPGWCGRIPIRVSVALFALACLILTQSRLALAISFAVSLVVALWKRGRPAIAGSVLVAAVVVAIGSIVLLPTLSELFVRGQGAHTLSTLTGRTDSWNLALEMWKDRPITGWGYYAGHRLGDFAIARGFLPTNIDSLWYESLLNVGLLGTVLLAAAVASSGVRPRFGDAEGASAHTSDSLLLLFFLSSFVSPSIQRVGLPLFMFGIVLLSRPHLRPEPLGSQTIEGRRSSSHSYSDVAAQSFRSLADQ